MAARHNAAGGHAVMLTVTIPHQRTDELGASMDVLALVRKRITAHGWSGHRDAMGVVGTIHAMEITKGVNGWHPHVHILILGSGKLRTKTLRAHAMLQLIQVCEEVGRRPPSVKHGVDARRVGRSGIGYYLSKAAPGWELAGANFKDRSALRQLASDAGDGCALQLREWWEYEAATKGRRAIVFSRGLKARYAVDERTDEECLSAYGEVVAVLTDREWSVWSRRECDLLELAEDHAGELVRRLARAGPS